MNGRDNGGQIVILSVLARQHHLRTRTQQRRGSSRRVFVGKVENGATWAVTSADGRVYLRLKLHDPGFNVRTNGKQLNNGDDLTALAPRPGRRGAEVLDGARYAGHCQPAVANSSSRSTR